VYRGTEHLDTAVSTTLAPPLTRPAR
jgi:hypothetical protein